MGRMDGPTLHRRSADRALDLPGTELEHPFGDDWDVFTVRGKIFCLHTKLDGELVANLKAAPLDAQALRENHPDITPGYHMNKRHWITLHPGGSIDEQLLDDLVTESYLLVVEKLPKKLRPVDPVTFGCPDETA